VHDALPLSATPEPTAPAEPPSASRTLFVADASELSRVRADDVALAIWRRRFDDATRAALLRLTEETEALDNHGELVAAEPGTFDALLAGVPDGPAREALSADLALLVPAFAALVERAHVHGALRVVRHDMCRKLHSDRIPMRLLCTYAGPATEYVDGPDVRTAFLARADLDIEEANRRVLRHPGALRHARVGDVLALKGDTWPGRRAPGAVHRSPPIEAGGRARLLLKLDVHGR
jgi:hypothetical protein